jgi:hypothetical protein
MAVGDTGAKLAVGGIGTGGSNGFVALGTSGLCVASGAPHRMDNTTTNTTHITSFGDFASLISLSLVAAISPAAK